MLEVIRLFLASIDRGQILLKRICALTKEYENFILGLALIILWIFPGYLLSSQEYSLEYDYIQNVRVAASINQGALLPLNFGGFNFIPEHQGSEVLKLMIIKVTGITIQELQFLPIGSILVPLTFFILCKECFDKKVAALLSISIAFDPTIVFGSFHTSIYAWSHPLFLIFIFFYVKILKKKTASDISLAILVFIGLYSIYWTDPALMVVFTLFVNIIIIIPWLLFERRNKPLPVIQTLSLAMAFLVIYMGFGGFAYRILPNILGKYAAGQFGTAVSSLYQRTLQLMGIAQPSEEVFSTYGETSPILSIQLIRYLIIIAPVGLCMLKEAISFVKTRTISIQNDVSRIIMWSLVGILLFDTIIYSSYGHASTRYIALLGPIVAMIALDRLKANPRIKIIVPAILGVLAFINFTIDIPQNPSHSNLQEIAPAANWFVEKTDQNRIMANVGTYGMITLITAPMDVLPVYSCFTDSAYRKMVNPNGEIVEPIITDTYIFIDNKQTNRETCPGFKFYKPLSSYLIQINDNMGFIRVYDNGSIWILKPI